MNDETKEIIEKSTDVLEILEILSKKDRNLEDSLYALARAYCIVTMLGKVNKEIALGIISETYNLMAEKKKEAEEKECKS